jgi:hypothetical protein
MLNEEIAYRLLSAVAHGHSWSILRLGFAPAGSEVGDVSIGGVMAKQFKKTPNVNGILYLGSCAANALMRPIWYQCRYFGWDEKRLVALLESGFDKLNLAPEVRFWRPASAEKA